jgi:hypothetical protein
MEPKMSTVFYGFKAASEQNLYEQVGIAKFLLANSTVLSPDGIEFQVFNTSQGIVYRPLERGYSLKNRLWKHPRFFPQCNYDNRVEIPEGDKKNEPLIDEIEGLIQLGQSYIIEIVPASGE